MNAGSLRWGISYSALLWASTVLMVPETAIAVPKETVLHSFLGGTDGSHPTGRLIRDGRGRFYGTTSQGGYSNACGGNGCGVIFELIPPQPGSNAWTESILYRFRGGTDGAAPLADLLRDKTGALYGTTSQGGGGACYSYYKYISGDLEIEIIWRDGSKVGCGTVFKLTPPANGGSVWTETVLYSFEGAEGRTPRGTPLMDKTGALYGATTQGGSGECGYFELTEHLFNSSSSSHLQIPTGCGTIFKLTPPTAGQTVWTETSLYSFQASGDGAFPGQPTVSSDGLPFYGTTSGGFTPGGASSKSFGYGVNGTAFALAPPQASQTSWTQSTLHVFGSGSDGSDPAGALILGKNGALYGVTQSGGKGSGTVFVLSPPVAGGTAWTETNLHFFKGWDGAQPVGIGPGTPTGGYYVVTGEGGNPSACGGSGCGTVLELSPPQSGTGAWAEKPLRRFDGNDGANPQARLERDQAGDLLGTTENGGPKGLGTVFKLSP